jgi:hypothetical protein
MNPRNGVRPGQRIAIAADHINFLNRLMREAKPSGAGGIGLSRPPYTVLRCRNDSGGSSGSVVPQFGILAITGLAIDIESPQFRSEPVLTGDTPNENTTEWCVAIEPIKGGDVGLVAVAGIVPAAVNIVRASHKWVRPGEDVDELITGPFGSARVLAKQSGTGTGKLALIELGHADDRRVCRFAGTWAKGTTATVEVLDEDWEPFGPTVEIDVVNLAADVETPNEESYGKLGCRRYGGAWVLDWFECDVEDTDEETEEE